MEVAWALSGANGLPASWRGGVRCIDGSIFFVRFSLLRLLLIECPPHPTKSYWNNLPLRDQTEPLQSSSNATLAWSMPLPCAEPVETPFSRRKYASRSSLILRGRLGNCWTTHRLSRGCTEARASPPPPSSAGRPVKTLNAPPLHCLWIRHRLQPSRNPRRF